MNLLAMIVGLLVVAVGAVGMAVPDALVAIGRDLVTPTGLYVIAVVRVGIGLVLVLAASTSRMPRTLRVVGGIVIIAGLTTPMFGVDRARAVMDWWVSQGPLFTRFAAVLAVAIGGFIIYAGGSAGQRGSR